jgi:hypothetical protein
MTQVRCLACNRLWPKGTVTCYCGQALTGTTSGLHVAKVIDSILELLPVWERGRNAELDAIIAMLAGPERDQRLQKLLLAQNKLGRLMYARLQQAQARDAAEAEQARHQQLDLFIVSEGEPHAWPAISNPQALG